MSLTTYSIIPLYTVSHYSRADIQDILEHHMVIITKINSYSQYITINIQVKPLASNTTPETEDLIQQLFHTSCAH